MDTKSWLGEVSSNFLQHSRMTQCNNILTYISKHKFFFWCFKNRASCFFKHFIFTIIAETWNVAQKPRGFKGGFWKMTGSWGGSFIGQALGAKKGRERCISLLLWLAPSSMMWAALLRYNSPTTDWKHEWKQTSLPLSYGCLTCCPSNKKIRHLPSSQIRTLKKTTFPKRVFVMTNMITEMVITISLFETKQSASTFLHFSVDTWHPSNTDFAAHCEVTVQTIPAAFKGHSEGLIYKGTYRQAFTLLPYTGLSSEHLSSRDCL